MIADDAIKPTEIKPALDHGLAVLHCQAQGDTAGCDIRGGAKQPFIDEKTSPCYCGETCNALRNTCFTTLQSKRMNLCARHQQSHLAQTRRKAEGGQKRPPGERRGGGKSM